MRPETIRRIRWTLSILTLSMAGWVVWSYFFSAAELRTPPANKIPLLEKDIVKSSERIEYSETQGNQIVFRVNAKKFVQTSDGMNTLEGIRAVNFGKIGDRLDSIESQTGQYDPKGEFVKFKGKVTIKTKEGAEILTESLSYAKSEETARTEDAFLFHRSDISGQGLGFIYDFRAGTLQILKNADFRINGAQQLGRPATADAIAIRSSLATLKRDYHFLFSHGASITQGPTRLEADGISVQFDSQGEAIESILANRSARLTLDSNQEKSHENQVMGGESISLRFTLQPNRLENVTAENQAFFAFNRKSEPPIQLSAGLITLNLDQSGDPTIMKASDDAEISQTKPGSLLWLQGGGLELRFQAGQRSPQSMSFDKPCRLRFLQPKQLLEMWAARMTGTFTGTPEASFEKIQAEKASVWVNPNLTPIPAVIGNLRVKELPGDFVHHFSSEKLQIDFEKTGNHPVAMMGESNSRLESRFIRGKEQGLRLMNAERMRVLFKPGSSLFESVEAGPKFRLHESLGSVNRYFRSDHAQANLIEASGQIGRADFRGGFFFEQGELRASSDIATYESAADRVRLEGNPRLWDPQSQTTAHALEVFGQGSEISGQGQVRSVFSGQKGGTLPLLGSITKAEHQDDQSIIIITSEAFRANRQDKKATYSGSSKASQGAYYIKADVLKIDQSSQTLEAEGGVDMQLSSVSAERAGKQARPVRAQAGRMVYSKANALMDLQGDVTVTDGDLRVSSLRTQVHFNPETQAMSRLNAFENVRIVRSGWFGSGDEGEYRVEDRHLMLTGKPAEIKDSTSRRSLGHRLTIHMSDDRLFVEN